MKGIGIIGEMIPDVILGGILLGLVSSSVLLTTLSPCSSASPAKEASYSKAPATGPASPTLASLPSKKSGSTEACSTYTANN